MRTLTRNFLAVFALAVSTTAQSQFEYTTNAGGTSLTITGYSGPETVIIPAAINGLAVADIGEYAIPEGVTSVSIPDTVTNIGLGAFDGCESLTNIAIPDSVISIGDGAFIGSGLTSLTIPSTLADVGDGAFASCAGLTNLSFSFGVTSIQSNMFSTCRNLPSVVIPSSVTNIGGGAFFQCTNITQVYFTGNAPNVGYYAFANFYPALMGPDVAYYTATAYYLPGTTGWAEFTSNTIIYSNRYQPATISVPAVMWNPTIQAAGTNFGVQNSQYGFDITGTTNLPIAIEACDDLSQSNWVVLQRLSLTNGLFHFSEPFQSNTPARFYRIGFP
jgi:hypothetical protein